jgi:PiT family inorganic phosphate transporter
LKKAGADAKLPKELRDKLTKLRKEKFLPAVEYVPLWVVIGTALALGIGTTIGYKRIVVTVAEKIGKQHLTYAQGAAAEAVAASTILIAAVTGLPVSTTHVLNSGVAGTMVANRSGLQWKTVGKILSAWVFTLPSCILLAGTLFWIGRLIVR